MVSLDDDPTAGPVTCRRGGHSEGTKTRQIRGRRETTRSILVERPLHASPAAARVVTRARSRPRGTGPAPIPTDRGPGPAWPGPLRCRNGPDPGLARARPAVDRRGQVDRRATDRARPVSHSSRPRARPARRRGPRAAVGLADFSAGYPVPAAVGRCGRSAAGGKMNRNRSGRNRSRPRPPYHLTSRSSVLAARTRTAARKTRRRI